MSLVFFLLRIVLSLLGSVLFYKKSPDNSLIRPFECGFIPIGTARSPFSLQFFLVALIFVIFDVELILLFPFIIRNGLTINSLRVLIYLLFIILLTGGLA